MKICAISDLHGHLPEIPECDLLLIAGDICPHMACPMQLNWMERKLKPWLSQQKASVIGIAGNHDLPFRDYPKAVKSMALNWTYLQDDYTHFQGLKIYGSPWSLMHRQWAFMAEESELVPVWYKIPNDADIVIVHGPPKFYGDLVLDGHHVGSESLLRRLVTIEPQLAVFGHIHEARGEWQFGRMKLANVTMAIKKREKTGDVHEFAAYDPWVYELKPG